MIAVLRRKDRSLASNYFLFSVAIFLFIILISVGFWVQTYNEALQRKREQLPSEAARVDSVFSDTLDYVAKYSEFVGVRIAHHAGRDLPYVADLIAGRLSTQPQEYEFFITTFDWVTPDGLMRASSKLGILPKPFDMSDRDYLKKARIQPWTLQTSAPRYGGLSHQWIIPAGMGVTDRAGNYLGAITMGFTLTRMAERIAQIMGKGDVRYLIVNDRMELVLDPEGDNAGPRPDFSRQPLDAGGMAERAGFLSQTFVRNGVKYNYYKRMNRYPYVVLVGHAAGMAHGMFNEIVLSRMLGSLLIGAVALMMLALLQRTLVQPVVRLADQASAISQGKEVMIQDSGILEIDLMGAQLRKIADYLRNERRTAEELAQKTELLEDKTHQLEEASKVALSARDAAVKADRAKSEFLANMSHEIRTPMNAIIGLTNILLMKEFEPERLRKYLQTMQTSAHQLMELINDLLDIAKLETQGVQLEQAPLNLCELIEEVASIGAVKATEKGLQLTTQCEGAGDKLLIGDALRLRQVLINLVSNAVKFTERGQVIVTLDQRIEGMRAQVTVTVQDTGIGIPAHKLESIFDKFSQADASITRRYGGTGLGLSISRMLVELMGGTLSVTSEEGKGASFICKLELPVSPTAMMEAPASAITDTAHAVPTNSNGYRVLLVEDNDANILVATAVLESLGYSYTLARHGQEALSRRVAENYDMILMDVQMPVMDGFEATRRIRDFERQEALSRMPIIGMTAYALVGDKDRCLDAGMDGYIAKPFGLRELAETLLRFTNTKQGKKERRETA